MYKKICTWFYWLTILVLCEKLYNIANKILLANLVSCVLGTSCHYVTDWRPVRIERFSQLIILCNDSRSPSGNFGSSLVGIIFFLISFNLHNYSNWTNTHFTFLSTSWISSCFSKQYNKKNVFHPREKHKLFWYQQWCWPGAN